MILIESLKSKQFSRFTVCDILLYMPNMRFIITWKNAEHTV